MAQQPDRLFVPLGTQPFAWFSSGRKQWELRRYGRQYTDKHVVSGRKVELRRGYSSGHALWGRIGRVIRAENLNTFFAIVPFNKVIPVASSLKDAIETAKNIMQVTESDSIIGFEVCWENERNQPRSTVSAACAERDENDDYTSRSS
jgi:hypothetical protein